jgi:hypothetical protein
MHGGERYNVLNRQNWFSPMARNVMLISWSKIHEQMGKVPARLLALQHSSQYLKEGMLRKLDENCVLRVLHEYAWRVAIPLREWG